MEKFKPLKQVPAKEKEKSTLEVKPVERDPTISASGDYWITLIQDIAQGEEFDPEHNPEDVARVERMLTALKNDVPPLCSCVMERACNLACTHCLYPWREKSAKAVAETNKLGDAVENIVRQLPEAEGAPQFLHSGKILQEWHLPILKRLRAARQNLQIGIIDNGTYVRHLNSGAFEDFRFDWIDISLDGTEESHNAQREPGHKEATGREPTAYKETIEGLERAREVTKSTLEGGKVNSLMTVTALNYKDIEAVADTLFAENPRAPGMPMADQMNITLMTPLREPNAYIELAKEWRTGNLDEMREVWEQICRVHTKYNTPDNQRVFFTLYRPLDIEKLAQAIGPKKIIDALTNAKIIGTGKVALTIDGVKVSYDAMSLAPREEIIIDADAVQRTAYSGQYTLAEYASGKSLDGKDVSFFSVDPLTSESDLKTQHIKGVERWWAGYGAKLLQEEIEIFKRIRDLAEKE